MVKLFVFLKRPGQSTGYVPEQKIWVCLSIGHFADNGLVLTLPACGNFGILARHKDLSGGSGCVLPLRARAGRTF